MKKAILAIGDKKTSEYSTARSFLRFIYNARILSRKKNIPFAVRSYKDALAGNLPEFNSKKIFVALFFPFDYWNQTIEVYGKDNRVYGDKKFGEEYAKFFRKIERILSQRYKNQSIEYLNTPDSCVKDRDKKLTKRILSKNGIPVPNSLIVRNLADLYKFTERGKSVYIKPRFGSMGKGISFASKKGVITNFLFRSGRIISHPYDYNWSFYKVRKKDELLRALISENMIFEEAVETPVVEDRKFDFRAYVIFDKVPYFYAKSSGVDMVVTNWSQGGRIEKNKSLRKFISPKNEQRLKAVVRKAAKTMGLKYAGIDVIFSKDFKDCRILEGHSFPGYEKGFDLMKFLAAEVFK